MNTTVELQLSIDQAGGVTPCQNAPDLFFPDPETDNVIRSYKMAKQLCSGCPVILECINYAVQAGETNGMWGGLTPEEIRKLRRRRAV